VRGEENSEDASVFAAERLCRLVCGTGCLLTFQLPVRWTHCFEINKEEIPWDNRGGHDSTNRLENRKSAVLKTIVVFEK